MEIWLVILFLSKKKLHAKQICALSSSMKLDPGSLRVWPHGGSPGQKYPQFNVWWSLNRIQWRTILDIIFCWKSTFFRKISDTTAPPDEPATYPAYLGWVLKVYYRLFWLIFEHFVFDTISYSYILMITVLAELKSGTFGHFFYTFAKRTYLMCHFT